MIRLGLCCKFFQEPIHFRTITATTLSRLSEAERLARLDEICLHNAQSLADALVFCSENDIRAFRINSQILPVKTHPDAGYQALDLPSGKKIVADFKQCGKFAQKNNIRLSFHPDQFVVLNSESLDVVKRSIQELEYQAQVAEWVGADVVNIHAGGGYGNKTEALRRLVKVVKALPKSIKDLITFENDDKTYSPQDLIPVCMEMGVPFVYDVHHHRCLPDGLTVGQATSGAVKSWGKREPLFHLSSPKDGWKGLKTFRHHDYIQIKDFPIEWKGLNITIEIEAKAKEVAILKLKGQLEDKGIR